MKTYGLVAPEGTSVGAMSDERWQAFFDMAAGQGLYPEDMDFRSAYTLTFVTPPAP
jgi:NitT/TauT family transport system substrate-binding protein